MHIFFIAQQRRLRYPDGFERGAVRIRITRLKKSVSLLRLRATQPSAIFAILKYIQSVDRRIACLIRDSFRIHRFDQAFCGGAGKLLGIDMEEVSVMAVAGATRVQRLRRDAGNLREQLVEQARDVFTGDKVLVFDGVSEWALYEICVDPKTQKEFKLVPQFFNCHSLKR